MIPDFFSPNISPHASRTDGHSVTNVSSNTSRIQKKKNLEGLEKYKQRKIKHGNKFNILKQIKGSKGRQGICRRTTTPRAEKNECMERIRKESHYLGSVGRPPS